MLLYDRLGPKAKAVIGNCHRIVNIAATVQAFLRQRRIPDPIMIDGDFYPAPPLKSIYTPEGDVEFARWLDDKVVKGDIGKRVVDLILEPIKIGAGTRRAQRLEMALGKRRRPR